VALDRVSGAVVEELRPPKPLRYVRALVVDRAGVVWIGHQAGLTRWDGRTFSAFDAASGLPEARVQALLLDREGRLWVGTWGGAAVCSPGPLGSAPGGGVDLGVAAMWKQANGLAADMVNVMLQDRRGGIWLGSSVAPRGGLSYLPPGSSPRGRPQQFTVANGLPHNNVTCLLEARDGSVWAGTGFVDLGGAARFVIGGDGRWRLAETLGTARGLAGAKVRSMYQDSTGALWFGSEYDGVARMSESGANVFTSKQGLAHNEVQAMLQDSAGNLWLGTFNGVTRLSADAVVHAQR
jgi:ligand-binding sensor domain-containing protein